jgi:hypothetical protein
MLALLDFVDQKYTALYDILSKLTRDLAVIPSAAILIAVGRGALLWLLNLTFFFAVLINMIKSG